MSNGQSSSSSRDGYATICVCGASAPTKATSDTVRKGTDTMTKHPQDLQNKFQDLAIGLGLPGHRLTFISVIHICGKFGRLRAVFHRPRTRLAVA